MSTQEKPTSSHCNHRNSHVARAGGSPRPPLPKVLGCQHFTVVQQFALGARAVQSRQDIIHTGEAAGHTHRGTVNLPLKQVGTRPLSHMGTLKHRTHSKPGFSSGRDGEMGSPGNKVGTGWGAAFHWALLRTRWGIGFSWRRDKKLSLHGFSVPAL